MSIDRNFSFLPNINKDKKEGHQYVAKLEDKLLFIKESKIETFEDWSKKTFEEKLSLLNTLGGIPFNLNSDTKKVKERFSEKFKKNEIEANLELDQGYDFLMRILNVPNYTEQSQNLYPRQSKNLAEFSEENDETKKYWEYSSHKYPEELLNLQPEVLNCLKKEEENSGNKNENKWLLSPIEALKNNGITNLSDWYNKSIEEKRKILLSGDFRDIDIEIKKGKPLMWSKETYVSYLDKHFFTTMYIISERLYARNQFINSVLNWDIILKNARENQVNIAEAEFQKKVKESQDVLDKNTEEIIKTMENKVDTELSKLSNEDRLEIKNFLESIYRENGDYKLKLTENDNLAK